MTVRKPGLWGTCGREISVVYMSVAWRAWLANAPRPLLVCVSFTSAVGGASNRRGHGSHEMRVRGGRKCAVTERTFDRKNVSENIYRARRKVFFRPNKRTFDPGITGLNLGQIACVAPRSSALLSFRHRGARCRESWPWCGGRGSAYWAEPAVPSLQRFFLGTSSRR